MKGRIAFVVAAIMGIFISSAPAHADWRNSFSIGQGVMKFETKDHQIRRVYNATYDCSTFLFWSWCGYDYSYEAADIRFSSRNAYSQWVQYEHLFSFGMSLETKIEYANSDYVLLNTEVNNLTGFGQVDVTKSFVALKYYFNRDGVLQPYLGTGFATYSAKLSAPVNKSFVNYINHYSVGVAKEFDVLRIYLQYYYSKAVSKEEASLDESGTAAIGEYIGELDLTDQGFNVGVSWIF